jgi:hypothetical protein
VLLSYASQLDIRLVKCEHGSEALVVRHMRTLLTNTPVPPEMHTENEPSVVGAWCSRYAMSVARFAMLMIEGSM